MLRTYVSWSLLVLLGLSSEACSSDSGDSNRDSVNHETRQDASDVEDAPDGQPTTDGDADGDGSVATDGERAMDAGSTQPSGMDSGTRGEAGCTGASCDGCKVALYLMADSTGSMTQAVVSGSAQVGDAGARDGGPAADAGDAARPPANTRIEALKNALHAFIDDPSTAGAQLGLGHFPHELPSDAGSCAPGTECSSGGSCCPGGTLCLSGVCLPLTVPGLTFAPSCKVSDYAKPDVELGEHAAVADAMRDAIRALRANGQSPAIVALEGALSYARTKVAARTKVSVVLFADGPWNACGPTPDGGMDALVQMGGPVEPLSEVAARYAMGPSGVNTYVVAIKGDADAGYFDPVAAAGGTQKAYNASSGDELFAALKAIREHAAAACK